MEAVVHTAMFLYISITGVSHKDLVHLMHTPYFICGSIATISLTVLVISTFHPFRKRFYKIFLVGHILLSSFAVIGCFVHILARYGDSRGHETWLYIAVAIWGWDRVLRILRWMSRGVRTAYVSTVDEDYLRVDIPGVSARGYVYLHFLLVSGWRIWESHPFSVGSMTSCQNASAYISGPEMRESKKEAHYFERKLYPTRADRQSVSTSRMPSTASDESETWKKGTGITLLIRRQSSLTSRLKTMENVPLGIPVLVEGSYNERITFMQDNHLQPTHEFLNIFCIAGGVGITGILPFLDEFEPTVGQYYSKKLFWVVRSLPLFLQWKTCSARVKSTMLQRDNGRCSL